MPEKIKEKITPIIMCGGAGARLFPVSRRDYPKPFMQIGGRSLLRHAFERVEAIGAAQVVVITNVAHLHLAQAEAADMPFAVHYLLEPEGRNTAPAIALACLYVEKLWGATSRCLVMTADHLISPLADFAADVALTTTENGLVVFGVAPTHPDTGYGYIGVVENSGEVQKVQSFKEKPDAATAATYIEAGTYYWNSGMFAFGVDVMSANFTAHASDVWTTAQAVFATSETANNITHFDAALFAAMPDISVDYAVIERSLDVVNVPAHFQWSDVGSWRSVADVQDKDENGNGAVGIDAAHLIMRDTHNSYVEVHSLDKKIVATIGLEDIVIIDMPDALLVATRDKAQEVRGIVDSLKAGDEFAQGLTQTPPVVHRPWGTYSTLNKQETGNKKENNYQVKRITVDVGQKLSLQYHHHRAEHWVVVQGIGEVQIGDDVFETRAGEYRYIPLGQKHRLTNIGDELLILIEVQCGDYLGEDDIVRLADDYGRS